MTTELYDRALAACLEARADKASGADRLRRVHDAGRLANDVQKTPGVRTSPSALTGLQTLQRAAGVSRPTLDQWRKVGRVGGRVRRNEGHVMIGTVETLNRSGYGFIRPDQPVGSSVFFPAAAVDRGLGYTFDGLRPGHAVEFDLVYDERGRAQGQHVRLIT